MTYPANSAVYYVSTSGNASNPGTIAQPWSLPHAVATAIAGDTVYVKAGNYGYLQLIFPNSGDSFKPICFIGYRSQPGDINSKDIPRTVAEYKNKDFSTLFPTLKGASRDSGVAFYIINKSNIHIANFYITKYTEGLEAYGPLCKNVNIENLIISELGDVSTYSGSALSLIYNSNSSVRHCFVYNSAAQGISLIQSNHCGIYDSFVLCDEDTLSAATDYYFLIAGGDTSNVTEYNVIDRCYAERIGNLKHLGHGFIISVNYATYSKGYSQYNTIKNCTSNNISEAVHARGGGVRFNLFYNCKSLSKGCIYSSEGSHHNTFEKIELNDTDYGAFSTYRSDVNSYFIDQPWATRSNVFKNCIFNRTLEGFSFDDWPTNTPSGSVDSNTFYHCNFISADPGNSYFGRSEVQNKSNTFVNCILQGFKNYAWSPGTVFQHTYFDFQNCLFWNNGFSSNSMDSATCSACITKDPLFVDAPKNDFHLNAKSPAIDAGKDSQISDDFEGNHRPSIKLYDIGAYEFQKDLTKSISIENYTKGLVSCYGSNNNMLTCKAEASEGFIVKYQWYKDGAIMPGETSPTLYFNDLDTLIIGSYQCKVYASGIPDTVWTDKIPVYVIIPPEITKQPSNIKNAVLGNTYSFEMNIKYQSKLPPDYRDSIQWFKYILSKNSLIPIQNDSRISGANSSKLVINNLNESDICEKGDYYFAKLMTPCLYVLSETVSITQMPKIVFLSNLIDTSICEGNVIEIKINYIAKNCDSLSFRWFFNDKPLSKQDDIAFDNAKLKLSNTNKNYSGKYFLEISAINENIKVRSESINLTVNEKPQIISQSPESITIIEDESFALSVDAVSFDTLKYQWFKNSVLLPNYNSNSIIKKNAKPEDSGIYLCEISNSCGTIYSKKINLTVDLKNDVDDIQSFGYSLSSPAPSPIINVSNVKYNIPNQANVKITISDINGSFETELLNQLMNAGEHSITIDSQQLEISSGTYFLKLESHGIVLVQKFIIIR